MRPTTLRNPNLHRGPSNSKEFNELRNDIHTDLSTLFAVANNHEVMYEESLDHLIKENFFIQNRLNKLEQLNKELVEKLERGVNGEGTMYKSFHHAENVIQTKEKNPLDINIEKGVIHPSVLKSINKISYKTSDGNHMLPKSFEATVLETNDMEEVDKETEDKRYYKVNATNLDAAFDGNRLTYWTRKSSFKNESCVTEVSAIFHFKIPQELSNNVYVNTIQLNPSPEFSMSLLDIQYKNTAGEWKRLDVYPTKTVNGIEQPIELKEIEKMSFHFPKKEIVELQIKVKQPYWMSHEGNRIFTYGFQDIQVLYNEYSKEEVEFATKLSLKGTNTYFKRVMEPNLKTSIGTPDVSDLLIEHELFFDENLAESFSFNAEIYQPIDEVFIKTTFSAVDNRIPFIEELSVGYEYEELN